MNAIEYIQTKQQIWAQRKGICLVGSKGERGEKNYTTTLNDNLYRPLTPVVKQAFLKGDGKELKPDGEKLPKMQAIHSSSALAVNVFQYWMMKDISTIASACGLCKK